MSNEFKKGELEMSDYSVELRHVTKQMGGVKRIDDVTVTLSAGKIYAIIGPNGAGNTTLLNIITGLYRADAGAVSVCGLHPLRDYKKVRTLIGLVPQETSLYPELSARDNLRFHAALYLDETKDMESKIDDILALVELSARADEPVKHYSGGMKR